MALLSVGLILTSVAHYTDVFQSQNTLSTGDWNVVFTDESAAMDLLIPGSEYNQVFKVENKGNIDVQVRGRVLLGDMDAKLLPLVNITTEAGGGKDLKVNEGLFLAESELLPGANIKGDYYISLNDAATLDVSGLEFDVTVVLEARQSGNTTWETVSTESITIGGSEIKIVPGR